MQDDSDDDWDFDGLKAKWQAARKKEFDFDEWAKEIENHPAFMTSSPKDGQLSEAAEALQAMKYDDEDDPITRAKAHKDDGNKNFELKKYRWAIDIYTEGIKIKCPDPQLNAVLYANRAACHFRLGNYRSALRDCLLARKFQPDHLKATLRGVDCLLQLNQPDEASTWIRDGETHIPDGDEAQKTRFAELGKRAQDMAKLKARNERKTKLAASKQRQEKLILLEEFKRRLIKFQKLDYLNDPDAFDLAKLDVMVPHEERVARVHFDPLTNCLVWPLLLLYPEFGQTDFVREFSDANTLRNHLEEIFASPAPWDTERQYNVDSIQVYFESAKRGAVLVQVPVDTTLRAVLSHPEYRLVGGFPSLIILSRNDFATKYTSRFSVISFV